MVNLTDFTDADLRKIRDVTSKKSKTRKCRLCRKTFQSTRKDQMFNSINCRVRYWQLKKEIGETELILRLDHLEKMKEIGDES